MTKFKIIRTLELNFLLSQKVRHVWCWTQGGFGSLVNNQLHTTKTTISLSVRKLDALLSD